ncbi:MAG: hypothetical protein JWO14_3015 [Solirubrobacterales bacterium]|nr:hypothetical protein [Solirubrobacterales bacterium]
MSACPKEVRLAPESIEALALRLSELLGRAEGSAGPNDSEQRMLTAAEVSRLWGVSRRWVYENAKALGARRLGDGPRPRLRFDPDEVADRLRLARADDDRTGAGARCGSPRKRNRGQPDNFDRGSRRAAGGRCNAPGPASKEVRRRAPKPSHGGRSR